MLCRALLAAMAILVLTAPVRAAECPALGLLAMTGNCEKLPVAENWVIDAFTVGGLALAPGERTNLFLLRINVDREFSALLKTQVRCPVVQARAVGDRYGLRVHAEPIYLECYGVQDKITRRLFLKGKISDPLDGLLGLHNMGPSPNPATPTISIYRNYRLKMLLTQILSEIPCRDCDYDTPPRRSRQGVAQAQGSLNATLPPESPDDPIPVLTPNGVQNSTSAGNSTAK